MLKHPQTLVDPAPPLGERPLGLAHTSRALVTAPTGFFTASARSHAVKVDSRRTKTKRSVDIARHRLAHPSVSQRATLQVRSALQCIGLHPGPLCLRPESQRIVLFDVATLT